MKKNFFKKLSFVLALAMIVSVLAPAAGALAASKPKLNATKKYLFLGETNKYDFNVSNKKSGWSYKWTSSNKAVATVASNGVTTGKSIGTAEISVVIKDKDGEEVTELTADVIVKDSIKTVKISNGPTDGKLAVGKEFDFNRSYTTYGGSTKKTTSVTKWSVDSDKATITSSGVFKATEAGEYTVTVRTFQSTAKYNAWLKDASAVKTVPTDSVKVTVAASMTGAKQVDGTSVNVTFDSAMTDVLKNVSVYQLVGTTKVKQLVKEVAMDADKKVATVKLYVDFTAESTYVIDYPNMESVSFVAATKKAEDVQKILITTTTATIKVAKPVVVKLLNADGVDITTPTLLGRVTMKSTGDVSTFFNATSKEVTIFTKGVTTTVTATYHSYKYNTTTGAEDGNLEASAVITGVEADATNLNGLSAWTLAANSGAANFGDVKQRISVGDASTNLYVEMNTLTGTTAGKVSNKTGSDFEFTSSDESVVILNGNTVIPVKEGSAVIVVKYGTAGATKTPVAAITITVGAKRAAASFTLSAYEFALSKSASVNDTKQVEISLKDQFGDDFTYTTYAVERLSGPDASVVTATGNSIAKGSGKITFTGANMTEGTYSYKVTVGGLSKVVVVTINKPAELTASYYKLELGATSIDLVAKAGATNSKSVTIDVFGYATNGVKVTKETLSALPATNGEFTVSIDAPTVNGAETYDVADYATANYTLSTATSGSAITKLPVGTYKVTLTQTINGNSVPVDVQYFEVVDTQLKPVLAEVSSQYFTGTVGDVLVATDAGLIQAAKDCLKITLDGADQDSNIVAVEAIGTVTSVFVKSVTVRQTIDGATIDHKVDVNTLIKK